MNGRGKRAKGAGGERELAGILSDELGFVVTRNLNQARDGGDDLTIQKFRIEVKRHERLSVMAWCEQVEKTCRQGDVPVVAFRQNGESWRVVLKLDDFIPMLRDQLE
jgi:Holliday junction resolvase